MARSKVGWYGWYPERAGWGFCASTGKVGLMCISKRRVPAPPFEPEGGRAQSGVGELSARNRPRAPLRAHVGAVWLLAACPSGLRAPGQGWLSLLAGGQRALRGRGGRAEARVGWEREPQAACGWVSRGGQVLSLTCPRGFCSLDPLPGCGAGRVGQQGKAAVGLAGLASWAQ